MTINVRNKGASGEREFCEWLFTRGLVQTIPDRNLEQVRSGGIDVIPVDHPFAYEVKRVEKITYFTTYDKWWMKARIDCQPLGRDPVVAHRKNRGDWVFLVSLEIILDYMMIGLTDRQACALIPLDVRFWSSWKRGARDTPSAFNEAYGKASDLQIAAMGEMVIDISDGTDTTTASLIEESLRNIDNPYAEGMNKQFERVVKGILQTNANRINARKWYVGKRLPSIYGDKLQLEHQGGEKPVGISFKNLSTEQLEKLADLEQSLGNT